MKIGRGKTNKRTLAFYARSFGLKPPFSVVIDGTFVQAALKQRIRIKEQLVNVFRGSWTVLIAILGVI
jgi:U3 small nucleolar RNA-associated protein 23